ncbi:MAG: DUF1553 domain-containing protein [Planctomycetaceae bacterium]
MPQQTTSQLRPQQATWTWLPVVWLMCQPLAAQSLTQIIDQEIAQHAGGKVSERCDDGEFLRRVFLDLGGRLPTATEARAFLDGRQQNKRSQLIDRLLAGADYPRRMQQFFTTALLERRSDTKVTDTEWSGYLRTAVAANKPWNELVTELLFSEPRADKSLRPQSRFFLVSGRADLHQKTRDIGRLFLGRDLMCAQCHNHPTIDDYLQADYFGLYSYLQETPAKAQAEFESVFNPGKKTTGPRLPGGQEVSIPKFEKGQEQEARKHRPRLLLAASLPRADNPLFVRNSVNRFWCLLMGRGLVHPLDMHHTTNPPSHPKLLDALAAHFTARKFDIRDLLRQIALSEAYQRSSRLPAATAEADAPFQSYRTAITKPLTPEQMAWAVMQATGNLQHVTQAQPTEKSSFTYKDYINGRIDGVPQSLEDTVKLFVGVFGNPPGEPEVVFNPAMGHALFLMNEPLILNWLEPRPGNLMHRITQLTDHDKMVEELYLSVLTRRPIPQETQEADEFLRQFSQQRATALRNLAWSLIASAEFRSNH